MSDDLWQSTPARLAVGKIFLLDGINGVRLLAGMFARGLRAAGLEHALEEFRWSKGLGFAPLFFDLWNSRHQRHQADRLVERIRQYRRDYPQRPVHFIAHSGGAAIVVYALERLSEQEKVTSAILAHPGLSPIYELQPALRKTTAGILAISSLVDAFFLGFGTTVLGTMDRRFSPAAGMLGFRRGTPLSSTEPVHPPLEQLRWHPGQIWRRGWYGFHVMAGTRRFVVGTMATWIRQAEASWQPATNTSLEDAEVTLQTENR